MEIIEIEDFLPQSLQDHIESILLDSNFDWHYITDVTTESTLSQYKQPGFQNTPFLNGVPHNKDYDFFSFMSPMILDYCENKKLSLSRIRIGLNVPSVNNTDTEYNSPHVDFNKFTMQEFTDNVVALYYVNNSEGDTFIFNEKIESNMYTIKKRISPKKCKLVLFDGNHYHSSSPAKNSNIRLVISLNYYDFSRKI